MTDTVKVLSDDEVAVVAAKKYLHIRQRDVTVAMDEVRNDIDSLCATVRALRAESERLHTDVGEMAQRLMRSADRCGELIIDKETAESENTALREQLAQRDQLLSDSTETEDRCRDLLAAYDQSSPEGVVPLDEVVRLVVGQLAHWQDRTRERTGEVERLQSELAQVTRERQLCLQVQKRGIHSSVTCPCVIAMEASNESPQP